MTDTEKYQYSLIKKLYMVTVYSDLKHLTEFQRAEIKREASLYIEKIESNNENK